MSFTFPVQPAPRRHPATEKAWWWVEFGPGRDRTPEDIDTIREILEEADAELFYLDRSTAQTRIGA